MIDVKQSFRRGKVICEIHVDDLTGIIFRNETVHKSINAAKKANRVTKYRVIPTGERSKLNGVWVRS